MVSLKLFVIGLLNCRSLWRATLLISLIAIVVLATTSKPYLIPAPGHDKLTHLLALLELTILVRLAWPTAKPLIYIPGLLAFALVIEGVQATLPYRVFSSADLLAGCVGVALGTLPWPWQFFSATQANEHT